MGTKGSQGNGEYPTKMGEYPGSPPFGVPWHGRRLIKAGGGAKTLGIAPEEALPGFSGPFGKGAVLFRPIQRPLARALSY